MKAMGEEAVRQMLDAAGVGDGRTAARGGGRADATSKLLGQLRLNLAKKDGLLKPDDYAFTWVVDFPLLEWDAEEKRYVRCTIRSRRRTTTTSAGSSTDPGAVRAKAYDLVLNGSEIGGGSIRIHDAALQRRIFSLLNISDEEASCGSGSSSRRSSTARRRTAASRSAWTASSPSWRARARSAKSSRSRRRPPPST